LQSGFLSTGIRIYRRNVRWGRDRTGFPEVGGGSVVDPPQRLFFGRGCKRSKDYFPDFRYETQRAKGLATFAPLIYQYANFVNMNLAQRGPDEAAERPPKGVGKLALIGYP